MGTGYFTIADLLAIWQSSVDPLYAEPFLEAGDGGGLEAFDQAFAQFQRVSQAINTATQSLYILPSSMQTDKPAGGDSFATVDLVLTRTTAFHVPLVLGAGVFVVGESATDWSTSGPVQVLTGRQYALTATTVIGAGVAGPVTAPAVATNPGYGYNNPLPGTISAISQPGVGQSSPNGTVVSGVGNDLLYVANDYTTFSASHVGQYFIFDSGANAGKIRRVVGYLPPSSVPFDNGGTVVLAQDVFMRVGTGASYLDGEAVSCPATGATGVLLHYDSASGHAIVQKTDGFFAAGGHLVGGATGTSTVIAEVDTVGTLAMLDVGVTPWSSGWSVSETLNQAVTGASGIFIGMFGNWAAVRTLSGQFAAGSAVVGVLSSVSMTPTIVGADPMLVSEPGTASWRVLSWATDLGVLVTNPEQPSGGKLGVLDELGRERLISRGTGESDQHYRRRVAQLPDTVSPNAIRRACSRVFTPIGVTCVLREVGTLDFPGFFYDAPSSDAPALAFAYDMNFGVRPQDRFRTYLDYADFRAYFQIQVHHTGLGEFGFAYDAHPLGFYNIGPALDFYDGFPATEAATNVRLWNDITWRKAGGVGFDFCI